MIDFDDDQLERYSRHILLDEVGIDGQEKILAAKILIAGGPLSCCSRNRHYRDC